MAGFHGTVEVMPKKNRHSKIFILVFVAVGFFGAGIAFVNSRQYLTTQPSNQGKQYPQSQNQNQPKDNSYQGYGFKTPFYNNNGIVLQHYWPGEPSFSNEETEILLFNESSSNVEVTSFDLAYLVNGKTYSHKSGTWEKFSTIQSWDRTQYLNISQNYYKGEPLLLTPGQKGKLHWHIQFGEKPLDGEQTVKIDLMLQKDRQSIPISQTLSRLSGAVFSKTGH